MGGSLTRAQFTHSIQVVSCVSETPDVRLGLLRYRLSHLPGCLGSVMFLLIELCFISYV